MSTLSRPVANSGIGETRTTRTRPAVLRGCCRTQSSLRSYQSCRRAKRDPAFTGGGDGKRAVSVGMMVWATSSDASIATTIGTATCTMNTDIWFFSPNTIGRKTMIVDRVPASTAVPTSRTPARVAAMG